MSIFWNIGPLYRSYYPDSLKGLSAVEAEEKIADWQLYSIGRSWVPHPSIPEGMVIAVSPRQYDSLTVTTPVRLLVSTGWTGVPRFVGLYITDARVLAEISNLVLITEERATEDILQDGIILEQLLPAGSQYLPGDSLIIIVGETDEDWGNW